MSARYLDRQLRETASEGIPRALLLKELGGKSFRIANIKEPRMRDPNKPSLPRCWARGLTRDKPQPESDSGASADLSGGLD